MNIRNVRFYFTWSMSGTAWFTASYTSIWRLANGWSDVTSAFPEMICRAWAEVPNTSGGFDKIVIADTMIEGLKDDKD